jgi:hypothetical protein
MKALLIKVFSDFYPDWIFQNVYGAIQDNLWVSFFLDAEELEGDLLNFFDNSQRALTSPHILEQVVLPEEFSGEFGDLYEVAGICSDIESPLHELDDLRQRNLWSGLSRTRQLTTAI